MQAFLERLTRSARPSHGCRATGRADQGVALLTVTIAIMVISAFLLVSLGYGIQNSTSGRRDQDAKIATAAAQAGIEEYLSRLNATPTYYTKGNTDPGNPALTTSGAGRPIQGTGTAGASYRYQVLTSPADTVATGYVRLKVTGTSGPDSARTVSRTLTANLRTKGFLSFIYLSDIEVVDPNLAGTANPLCTKHYFEGRNATGACSEIQWTGGDTVNGPLHSNDALQINGAVNFRNATTETGCPDTLLTGNSTFCPPAKKWWGSATTLSGKKPYFAPSIALPDANDTLSTYTTPGADGNQTGPGCYYQGATRITFNGSSMSVLSPSTTAATVPKASASKCYNTATPNVPQTYPIPPVIYVDETSASCSFKNVGYPATNESVSNQSATLPDSSYWLSTGSNKTTNYRCGRGTAYVSGTADAQVTVASADDIVVTGNLADSDNMAGTDVIGLIADNNVWVYHPLNSSSNEVLASANTVTSIQAAILSVSHSFVVQNWADGNPLGTLSVVGAIAQKYRGAVGTGNGTTLSTGYYKNYVYDPRLAFLQPPYFLAPTSSQWLVSSVTDN